MRLALELALARSVGRLSRLAGRGGGTTVPGKILATIDPGAVSTLAARLPLGTAAISATNGKTTTTALVAAILGKRVRLAHNGSGANLVSGVASTLIEARDAELGLFEVDEGAFPEIARRIRPRAVCLGNLFRDQLDRYGELEQIAERWRAAVGGASGGGHAGRERRRPAGRRSGARLASGQRHLRHRRSGAGTPDAPARAGLEVLPALRDAVRLRRRLRRAPRGLPLPRLRARATSAGPRARAIELHGLEAVSFDLVTPEGTRRVRLGLPGPLQRLQRVSRPRRSHGRSARPSKRSREGSERAAPAFGRVERIDARRPAAAASADQESGRCERGRADGRRRGGAQGRGRCAQRCDRRRPGRLVDLGRRLRAAPRVPGAGRRLRRPRCRARASLHLRGLPRGCRRDRPRARARARPRARADVRGAASSSSSPPTRRCSSCAGSSPSADTSPVLGARGMRVRVGHLYPDYLNIYADRGNIAVLDARAARCVGSTSRSSAIGLGEAVDPGGHDLLYVGGGQDREQALIAADIAAKGPALREAVAGGVAVLAVCGGYQLLGRFYRDRYGSELPGAGVLPLHTVAGERRMIGDVLLECELEPGRRETLAGFENHAGRTILDEGAEPLGRVVAGFGNDGDSGFEGCRLGRAIGTYLHGPLLPRNPWLADWILAQAARARDRRRGARVRAAGRPSGGRGACRVCCPRAPPRRQVLARSEELTLRAPRAGRGRRSGLRAASARGSRWIGGCRTTSSSSPSPNSRWPRTAASADVTVSSDRPPRSAEKMMWTTCFAGESRAAARSSRRSRSALRTAWGRRSPPPRAARGAGRRRATRRSSTPPPGSSQYSFPGFSCRQSRMRSRQRSSADTRMRGSTPISGAPRSRSRPRRARWPASASTSSQLACGTATTTSWAIRMPGSTTNVSRGSVLWRITRSSPR